MFRHYVSFRVQFFVGITLVALTSSAIAGMNLNNVSKAMPEVGEHALNSSSCISPTDDRGQISPRLQF